MILIICKKKQFFVNISNFPEQTVCLPVKFEEDSVVCKCNSTYCDFLKIPKIIPKGEFIDISSDKAGKRFFIQTGAILKDQNDGIIVNVNSTVRYQQIIGFGGAFTDSAGFNIKNLSKDAQQNLLRYCCNFRSQFANTSLNKTEVFK